MKSIFSEGLINELDEGQFREYHSNLVSYIRSRLNNINTSVYLLQSQTTQANLESVRYFQKINEEIDAIRKLINE